MAIGFVWVTDVRVIHMIHSY